MYYVKKLAPIYCLVISAFLAFTLLTDRAVTALAPDEGNCISAPVFVIDPGHGGIDGGATSCTGILESEINLQIALRLNDLMGLLGRQTVMIRTTDCSVHTQGETIASQKISDLKNRVSLVNSTCNGVLISLHQNTFPESKYSGAQVFYGNDPQSKPLAERLQTALVQYLDPDSNRKCRKGEGIYLLEHINAPGVLIECGFLSNPAEEAKLRSEKYQMQLCTVLAACLTEEFWLKDGVP